MIKLSEENPVMAGSSAHTVLRLFYENGPASQMEIARKLRITKAASNQHFSRLIEENYITESAVQPNPRGRPSQVWQIDSARNFFLGLTVEDGALGAVLTDFSENVLIRANRHLHDRADQTALLKLLDDLLKTILNKISKLGGRLLQCFAAIPGMIDQEGLITNCPNFHALDGLNLDQLLAERYSIPVFSDACSNAYIAAECRNISQDSTIMILNWSDGIGLSVICNGVPLQWPAVNVKRFRGLWDFSHIRIVKEGRLCHCGKRGCLEAYYGGNALVELNPELHVSSAEELANAVINDAAGARRVVSEAAAALAEQLYWVIELFGIDTVIFSGTLASAFEYYHRAFCDRLKSFYTDEEFAVFSIRQGDPSPENIQLGAALVAKNFFFYTQRLRNSRGIWNKTGKLNPLSK